MGHHQLGVSLDVGLKYFIILPPGAGPSHAGDGLEVVGPPESFILDAFQRVWQGDAFQRVAPGKTPQRNNSYIIREIDFPQLAAYSEGLVPHCRDRIGHGHLLKGITHAESIVADRGDAVRDIHFGERAQRESTIADGRYLVGNAVMDDILRDVDNARVGVGTGNLLVSDLDSIALLDVVVNTIGVEVVGAGAEGAHHGRYQCDPSKE